MIVVYEEKYEQEVKKLLRELQEHICSLDKEGYNIIDSSYEEQYFKRTMEEICTCSGKMLLYLYDNKVVGLVVGIINNEVESTYDFVAPKRGRITELVVSSSYRNKGIGEALLNASEKYLFKMGCKDVLLGVFGYNEKAISFYEKHGYHVRMLDMSKDITINK